MATSDDVMQHIDDVLLGTDKFSGAVGKQSAAVPNSPASASPIFDSTPNSTEHSTLPKADHTSAALRTDGAIASRSAAIGNATGSRSHIGNTVPTNSLSRRTSTLGEISYATAGNAIGSAVAQTQAEVVKTPLDRRQRPVVSLSRVQLAIQQLRENPPIAIFGPGANVSGKPPRDNLTLAKAELEQSNSSLGGLAAEAQGIGIVENVLVVPVATNPEGFGRAPSIDRSGVNRDDSRENYGLVG
jgi:hypothetical protein